jgi:hypothetical protein
VQESMTIKVRNFTGFDMSRQSLSVTKGRWGNNSSAEPPSDLANGDTATFSSEAVNELDGTSGSVAYMTTAGIFGIEWTVPLMGQYTLQVTMPPGYEQDTIESASTAGNLNDSNPSVKIILQPPE